MSDVPGPVRTTDVLGDPWWSEPIALPDDDEGECLATLVGRDREGGSGRAVLHVHGFADYFFHVEYAAWWLERGYDFRALDLRKYGRSLRPHHTPNFVTDLAEHFVELDEAWRRLTERDGHDRVVVSAHSTGGLVVALWADHRRRSGRPLTALAGLVLNSPWFDMQGAWWMRTIGTRLIHHVGGRSPRRVVRRTVSGLYARSLHAQHEGEFDFDLSWKPVESFEVHTGWLRAVRAGHARLHRGLEVGAPALVLSSARSVQPREMGQDVHTADIVLDVEQIRRWTPCLGHHVTSVAVDGARHDVVLSLPHVRAEVYDALDRWRTAYVDDGRASRRD